MSVKKDTTALLSKLRSLMINKKVVKEPLSGYLIPFRDAHYSPYLAAWDERLAFISGFGGAEGDVLVTASKALLWTDDGYHGEAAEQVDKNWTIMGLGPDSPTESEWINQEMERGSVIGIDPRLLTSDRWTKLEKELEARGNRLVAVDMNLVDLIWEGRPEVPSNPVTELPLEFAGKSTADKFVEVRNEMRKEGAQYLLVSALDEIAWFLNWRGSDIPYSPVFLSHLIISHDFLHVFIDDGKLADELLLETSTPDQDWKVSIYYYDQIRTVLEDLVKKKTYKSGKFWLSKYTSYYLTSAIPESRRITKLPPITYLKLVKNPVEVTGMRNCHVRDAAAICQFFGWLEKALLAGDVVTEVDASEKLEEFRSKLANYTGPSFPSVVRSGQNCAKVKLNSAPTSQQLSLKDLIVIDTGGHYLDGTTDVARTVHFGEPTHLQKKYYTTLLREEIDMVSAIVPNKFERKAVNNLGFDYLQQAGHKVGLYTDVSGDPGLQMNMFMTKKNEYCHGNEFGMRLGNVIRTLQAGDQYSFGGRISLTFETVTMVPFQLKMIDPAGLHLVERHYINSYHQDCRQKVGDYMKSVGTPDTDPGYVWLIRETELLEGTPALA